MLLKDERPWYQGSNLVSANATASRALPLLTALAHQFWSFLNGGAIVLGAVLLVCGVYASAEDLMAT